METKNEEKQEQNAKTNQIIKEVIEEDALEQERIFEEMFGEKGSDDVSLNDYRKALENYNIQKAKLDNAELVLKQAKELTFEQWKAGKNF